MKLSLIRSLEVLGLWLLGLAPAPGQGTIVALNTGAGQPLISEVRALFVDATLTQPTLLFNFGFATDETIQAGTIPDSFSVTLQDANQLFTAIYLTIDISGLLLAPPGSGTIPLDPSTILTGAITYPSLQPVLLTQRAFQVTAAIPTQFSGQPVNVFFDLSDNLDARASQAWFSAIRVANAPEPGVTSLLLLVGGVFWASRRNRR